MDAKYNWLIDNGAIRLTLNTVAFALWIAMAGRRLDGTSGKDLTAQFVRPRSAAPNGHPAGSIMSVPVRPVSDPRGTTEIIGTSDL